MPEHEPIGRIHIERLRLGGAVATGRRIAHMADADITPQLEHVLLAEDIAHQPLPLAHADKAIGDGDDARRVLAAVLQHRQRVIEPLVDGGSADDGCDAAHGVSLRLGCRWASHLVEQTLGLATAVVHLLDHLRVEPAAGERLEVDDAV